MKYKDTCKCPICCEFHEVEAEANEGDSMCDVLLYEACDKPICSYISKLEYEICNLKGELERLARQRKVIVIEKYISNKK